MDAKELQAQIEKNMLELEKSKEKVLYYSHQVEELMKKVWRPDGTWHHNMYMDNVEIVYKEHTRQELEEWWDNLPEAEVVVVDVA